IVRLAPDAALRDRLITTRRGTGPVDDRPERSPDHSLAAISRYRALSALYTVLALALDRLGHVVLERGSVGAFLFRVGENADAVEAELVQQVDQLLDVLLGLAGKTDNAGRSNRNLRHRGSRARNSRSQRLTTLGATHTGEHGI